MIRCAILCGTAVPSPDGPGAALQAPLHPREAALLGPRAVPKRRADFARGRWIAKQLIRHVRPNTDLSTLSILPDDDGVPWIHDESSGQWRMSLSISHCRDYAAAAVTELPSRVGVDVETTLEQPRLIADEYFTSSERELLRSVDDEGRSNDATAVWALKEAALKVLGVGLRAPSSSVVVQRLGGRDRSPVWIRTSVGTSDGLELCAWYRTLPGGVIAIAVQPGIGGDPPIPLWFE